MADARPTVTFPTAAHNRPLTGTKLHCLVTEAHVCEQLAPGCQQKAQGRESNSLPSEVMSQESNVTCFHSSLHSHWLLFSRSSRLPRPLPLPRIRNYLTKSYPAQAISYGHSCHHLLHKITVLEIDLTIDSYLTVYLE